jgi:tetratricopeptide (TPR) repeat protein
VLALQSEVALAIAEAIRAELTGDERERIAHFHEVDPAAYEEYLLGMNGRAEGTPQGLLSGVQHLDRATQLDPDFAEAWAYFGVTYALMAGSGMMPQPGTMFPRARAGALRALELDPDLAAAHAALGLVAMAYDWEWDQAETRFARALESDPNLTIGHMFMGLYLLMTGRNDEAIEAAERALELDPENPWTGRTALMVITLAGRPDGVIGRLEDLFDKRPEFLEIRTVLRMAYADLGENEKAFEVSNVSRDGEPLRAIEMIGLAEAEAIRGNEAAARQMLADAVASGQYFDAVFVVPIFVYLGDYESALESIERAIRDHATAIVLLRNGPYRA